MIVRRNEQIRGRITPAEDMEPSELISIKSSQLQSFSVTNEPPREHEMDEACQIE